MMEKTESMRSIWRADRRANHREYRSLVLLASLRLTQALMGDLAKPHWWSWPAIASHRFLSEFLLQMELRPRTSVGAGLAIHHGFGLVVNDHAVIGRGVTLKNGLTIGHARPGVGCPVLRDYVEVGAGAVIIGDIELGAHSVVGAGAVVVRDVAAGVIVAGNPAKVIRVRPEVEWR